MAQRCQREEGREAQGLEAARQERMSQRTVPSHLQAHCQSGVRKHTSPLSVNALEETSFASAFLCPPAGLRGGCTAGGTFVPEDSWFPIAAWAFCRLLLSSWWTCPVSLPGSSPPLVPTPVFPDPRSCHPLDPDSSLLSPRIPSSLDCASVSPSHTAFWHSSGLSNGLAGQGEEWGGGRAPLPLCLPRAGGRIQKHMLCVIMVRTRQAGAFARWPQSGEGEAEV